MTSSHGRRIQGRRALAILAWATLVIVAGLLWYGQYKRIIRIQAWEPAALLLSAYATFLAIFGWMLFSPGRKSAEESPGLFFSGMLTLIPPCFIAYHLMPVGSPLKPWLTIGVFVFGVIAIMSPLPEEVFAIPRERRTYLQPLTDAYLTELNVDEPQVHFEDVAPRTAYWLSRPAEDASASRSTEARDPWGDPFLGTGRQLSRIGVSQSRRAEETSRSDRRRPLDDASDLNSFNANSPGMPVQPSFGNLTPLRAPAKPASDFSDTAPDTSTGRRPLTERGGRANNPVGFQSPPIAPRVISQSPPPLPTGTFSQTKPSVLNLPPISALPIVVSPPALRTKPEAASNVTAFSLHETPAVTSLAASQLVTSTNPLPDLTDVLATIEHPKSIRVPEVASGSRAVTEPSTAAMLLTKPVSATREKTLQELDREIRQQEASLVEADSGVPTDGDGDDDDDDDDEKLMESAARIPAVGVTRSVSQPSGDISLERIRDEHGGEMIEGTVKVFFEVGQKRAHLHVPFSPPLAGLPEVECEPADDQSIRIKVAVRQPYGVRIEARRAEASEALRTEISFAAVYTPANRRG